MKTTRRLTGILALFLVLCLLPLPALAQSGGVLENAKKPDYESALQELRSANLGDIKRLEVVRDKLEGVGFHLLSVQYRLFVEALLVLARDEKEHFDKALQNVLGLVDSTKFVKEYSQQPNFPDLLDLAEYIRAREMEANNNYSGAIQIYRKYPEVLDALIRASDLSDKVTPTPKPTSTIKPTPTPTLVPTLQPPASISVSVMSSSTIIRWSAVSGAKEYLVYRTDMTRGIASGLIATVTGTEYRDGTVEAGHTYRYQVAAVNGTKTSELTAYAEAEMPTPTPKPTPTPSPVPTHTPTKKPTPVPTVKPAPKPTPTKRPGSVGTIVIFGKYEQDNDKSNGTESIAWRVLKEERDKVLLISEKNLLRKPYNNTKVEGWDTRITWETCTLRTWLNNNFLNSAFTSEERKNILTVTVKNKGTSIYELTDGGRDTKDRIFLLSIEEAENLFSDNHDRRSQNTKYLEAVSSEFVNVSYWWLRSKGQYPWFAAGVFSDGSIDYNGDIVNFGFDAVRPALWVDLYSGIF